MHINRETSTEMSDHHERADVVVSNVPHPGPRSLFPYPLSPSRSILFLPSLSLRAFRNAFLFRFQHTPPTRRYDSSLILMNVALRDRSGAQIKYDAP